MTEEIIPPISPRTHRTSVRTEFVVFAVAAIVLLLAQGPSVRRTGERMDKGVIRTGVLAVGKPFGWLGDQLPFADAAHDITAWLSPDEDLSSGPGGFAQSVNQTSGVPPVTPDAFTPAELGEDPAPKRDLKTLLVTGDSMSQLLSEEIARRFADGDVDVIRDVHIGTGISKTTLVDWGKLSTRQTTKDDPDAVVMFIGANDGFPIGKVNCCSAEWAAAYATRARTMMNTYRQDGDTVVYWLSLPIPRDGDLADIVQVVNAGVRAAATAYGRDVHILDMTTLFTPDGKFRDEMEVDGKEQLVRDADGIHLNERGADLAVDEVLDAMAQDFNGVDSG